MIVGVQKKKQSLTKVTVDFFLKKNQISIIGIIIKLTFRHSSRRNLDWLGRRENRRRRFSSFDDRSAFASFTSSREKSIYSL